MMNNTDTSSTLHAFSGVIQKPLGLWEQLIRPHPSIEDVDGQHHARLLAGLTLVLFVGGAVIALYLFAIGIFTLNNPDEPVLLAALLSLPVAYTLTRRGHYKTASWIMIVLTFAVGVITPFLDTASIALLVLTILPVLLTAYFYSSRTVVMVLIVTSGASLLQIMRLAGADFDTRFNYNLMVIFITLIGIAIIIFKNHLQRIEHERQHGLELLVLERTRDLRLAKTEAERARDQAIKSDRVKSQFLASMSHELRTPLNSILTFSELMAMGTFGDVNEEQTEYLHKVLFSGKHLLGLINDVLDISKMESGMMKLFIEEDFDIAAEVQQISATIEKTIGDKPVELVIDVDSDFPLLAVDKRRVRQVLLNLLSNAVKFTEEGTITLSAKKKPDEILFAVIDTGPGIPKNQHHMIFEPFIQSETGIKHAGGTGLGLPISKRLVEAHGGRLWLTSNPGEGAAFYFTLPTTPALNVGEVALETT
jgi:signal transduction histidine kinase